MSPKKGLSSLAFLLDPRTKSWAFLPPLVSISDHAMKTRWDGHCFWHYAVRKGKEALLHSIAIPHLPSSLLPYYSGSEGSRRCWRWHNESALSLFCAVHTVYCAESSRQVGGRGKGRKGWEGKVWRALVGQEECQSEKMKAEMKKKKIVLVIFCWYLVYCNSIAYFSFALLNPGMRGNFPPGWSIHPSS